MATYNFENKVAFVTGAARGQGRCHAEKYAENGADVVVTDIRTGELEETVKRVEEIGQQVLQIELDVSDESAVKSAVETTVEEFGRIDFLVNNAGIWEISPAIEIEEASWNQVIDVNLKGVWLCSKHVGRWMVNNGVSGNIINIASAAGTTGWENSAHYVASKHGVVGLTKALAIELAEHDINVNAIGPGAIGTSMTTEVIREKMEQGTQDLIPDFQTLHGSLNLFDPDGETPIEPEEVSKACLWLSSADSQAITGATIPVDAGFTIK